MKKIFLFLTALALIASAQAQTTNTYSNAYAGGTIGSGTTSLITNGASITGNITDNGTLLFMQSSAITNVNSLTGNGMVTQSGTGTTVLNPTGLNAINNFAGGFTVNRGLLDITATASTTSFVNATINGGVLNMTANLSSMTNLAVNGGLMNLNGTYNNSAGAPITVGSGTLSLNKQDVLGTWESSIATPITINAGGVLQNGTNSANNGYVYNTLGAVTLNGGTIQSLGTNGNNSSGTAFGLKGTITVTGSGTSTIAGPGIALGEAAVTSTTFNVSSGAILNASANLVNGDDASAFLYAGWGNKHASSLVKSGDGVMIVGGSNTYTGTTMVSGGTLRAGSTTAFGNNSAVIISNTAGVLLDLNGYNNTIGTLAGGGTSGGNITLGSGTLSINEGTGASNTTYAGSISGTGGVVVNSSSSRTLTITGSNSFTGPLIANNPSGYNYANAPVLVLSNASGNAIQGNLVIGNASSGTATVGAYAANQFGSNSVIVFNSLASGSANASYLVMRASQNVAGLSGTMGGAGGAIEVNQFGDSSNYGSQTLTVNVAAGTNYTLNGGSGGSGNIRNVDGSGSSVLTLVKSGAGLQTLTNVNITQTGGTIVNQGTLAVQGGANNSANITVSGGTMRLDGASAISAYSGTNVSIASGATFQLNGPDADNGTSSGTAQGNAEFGGNSSSGSPLIISGAGTWLITGNTTNNVIELGNNSGNSLKINMSQGGLINVASGTLRSGGYSAPDWTSNRASLNVATGAAFQLWDGNRPVTVDSLTGGGLIGNALGNNAVTLNLGVANGSGTFSGQIANNIMGATGNTTSLTKLGTGTQILSGTNIYSGVTTVGAGVLEFANPYAYYSNNNGNSFWNANYLTVSNGATLAFGVGGASSFSTSNITSILSALTNTSAKGFLSNSSVGFDVAGGNFTLTNNLGNSTNGTLGLLTYGGNTLTVTGSNNYTGTTRIDSGTTLQVGSGGSSGTLGSGSVTDNGTLAFNRSGSLSISAPITGSGAVSQIGSGTTILSGNNSYTGTTTVSAGTLNIGTNGGSNLTVGNGAGQTTNLLVNGGTLVNASATIGSQSNTVGSATVSSGLWNNSGALTVGSNGSGSLNISGGMVTNSGNSSIAANAGSTGSVAVTGGSWNSGGNLTVGDSGTGSLTISGGTVSASYSSIGNLSGSTGRVTINSGTWNNAGQLAVGISGNGSLIINGGTVSNGVGYIGFNGYVGATGNGAVTVNTNGSWINSGNLTVGNSGIGSLTLNGGTVSVQGGSGTVTLANNSGSTGTLNLGNGGPSIGTIQAAEIAGGSGTATVNVNSTGTANLGQNFTGYLKFNQLGTGTTILSGNNSYTGGTVINAGTLSTLGNERLADTGAVTVNSGATFKLGGNETIGSLSGAGTANVGANTLTLSSGSFSGALAGSGDLVKNGSGTFTLSGTSTGYTGDLYLNAGNVISGSTSALNADNYILLSAGSTFTANQNLVLGGIDQNGGTIDGSGVITAVSTITRSGALNSVLGDVSGYNSGLLKLGDGTTTLGAANTYTGLTKVSGGTLALGASGSLATNSSAQIAAGAKLDLGSRSQTLSDVKANGLIAGSGTFTVNGTLSGSGTITPDTVIIGTHAPGNSPGIQTFGGNLTYNSGAGILLQFADNTTNNSPISYDQIRVDKNLNFRGLTTLNIAFGDTGSAVDWNNEFWQSSQSWTLYSVSGITTGFENLTLNSTNWTDANGLLFGDTLTNGTFSLTLGQNGQDIVLNYAVPEPSTYALMGLGSLALVLAYRRRRA